MRAEKPAPPLHGRALWLVVGTLALGGLAFLALGIAGLLPAVRSSSWPSVQGIVTGHRIESVHLNKSTNYQVGVAYVYEVARTRHTGHHFSHTSSPLPMSFSSREAAEAAYASEPSFKDWQSGQLVTCLMIRRSQQSRYC